MQTSATGEPNSSQRTDELLSASISPAQQGTTITTGFPCSSSNEGQRRWPCGGGRSSSARRAPPRPSRGRSAGHLGLLHRPENGACQHLCAQRHAAELELRDDPEVAAAAAHAPERSAFSSALALTNSPSAVTRSTETSWSTDNPCLRMIQPIPPPSVSPATPVCVTMPDGTASPNACVSRSSSPSRTPACTRAVRCSGSTRTPSSVTGRSSARRLRPTDPGTSARRSAPKPAGRSRARASRRQSRPRRRRNERSRPGACRTSRSRSCAARRTPDLGRTTPAEGSLVDLDRVNDLGHDASLASGAAGRSARRTLMPLPPGAGHRRSRADRPV